jgi:hypothetical protein
MSGKMKRPEWNKVTTVALENLPMQNSIITIERESYFDWLVWP